MASVKARVKAHEVFKVGDTVSVIGFLLSNGQWRYETAKPFLVPDTDSFWQRSAFQTVDLGIIGGTHRGDTGLGATWADVRLLQPTDDETAGRLEQLGFALLPDYPGTNVRRLGR